MSAFTPYEAEGFLCLAVWDNGRGMTEEQIELLLRGRARRQDDNSSIGLENVQARLRLNFGEAARIKFESELRKFTRVTLEIPLRSLSRKNEKENGHDTDNDCG